MIENDEVTGRKLVRCLWFAYMSLLICWGALSYAELGNLMRSGKLHAYTSNGRPYVSDFVDYYSAARLAGACRRQQLNIYDPQVQASSQNELIAPVKVEQPFYLQYPPFFFSLVSPLSNFDLNWAWLIWCGLGLVLTAAGLWVLLGRVAHRKTGRLFTALAFFASYPTWLSFKLGQTSLWLLPFLLVSWVALSRHKYFLSGLSTALCTVKLQYAPLVLLSGCIWGRVRYLVGFLVALAVLIFIAGQQLGWNNILAYPGALIYAETHAGLSGVSAESMQNIRGELVLLTGSDGQTVQSLSVTGLLLAFAFNGWLWWRASRLTGSKEQTFNFCASVSTLLLLVASPHTHIQDYIVVLIPSLWLWDLTGRTQSDVKGRILKILILSFPVLSWLFFLCRKPLAAAFIQPYFFWDLAVMLLALKKFGPLLAGGRSPILQNQADDTGKR